MEQGWIRCTVSHAVCRAWLTAARVVALAAAAVAVVAARPYVSLSTAPCRMRPQRRLRVTLQKIEAAGIELNLETMRSDLCGGGGGGGR